MSRLIYNVMALVWILEQCEEDTRGDRLVKWRGFLLQLLSYQDYITRNKLFDEMRESLSGPGMLDDFQPIVPGWSALYGVNAEKLLLGLAQDIFDEINHQASSKR